MGCYAMTEAMFVKMFKSSKSCVSHQKVACLLFSNVYFWIEIFFKQFDMTTIMYQEDC